MNAMSTESMDVWIWAAEWTLTYFVYRRVGYHHLCNVPIEEVVGVIDFDS